MLIVARAEIVPAEITDAPTTISALDNWSAANLGIRAAKWSMTSIQMRDVVVRARTVDTGVWLEIRKINLEMDSARFDRNPTERTKINSWKNVLADHDCQYIKFGRICNFRAAIARNSTMQAYSPKRTSTCRSAYRARVIFNRCVTENANHFFQEHWLFFGLDFDSFRVLGVKQALFIVFCLCEWNCSIAK